MRWGERRESQDGTKVAQKDDDDDNREKKGSGMRSVLQEVVETMGNVGSEF